MLKSYYACTTWIQNVATLISEVETRFSIWFVRTATRWKVMNFQRSSKGSVLIILSNRVWLECLGSCSYSCAPNNRACTIIIFSKIGHPIRTYQGLYNYQFLTSNDLKILYLNYLEIRLPYTIIRVYTFIRNSRVSLTRVNIVM